MTWRVVLGLAWLIAFTTWFHSFGLPNNPPAARWMIWARLPFDLMDLVDPPVIENAAPWGWHHLGQRVPFLLSASIIWLSAWGLGSLILRCLRLRGDLDRSERLFFSGCLGLAGVSLGMLGLGLLGLMSRWPLLALTVASVVVEVWYSRREGGTPGERYGRATLENKTSRQKAFQPLTTSLARWTPLVVAPFVCCMLLGALSPQTDFDVIEYHLGGPKEWFQQGFIARLPHNVYTSFPFLTEMLLLCGMVLHGDWESGALAGQTIIAGFAPLTALGLYATGKRWFGQSAGSLAALVWLTTPWAYRISIIAYAEGGLACYLLAALAVGLRIVWRGAEDGNQESEVTGQGDHDESNLVPSPPSSGERGPGTELRLVLLCGLLAGCAMACKYTGAVSVVLPLAAMIALRSACSKRTLSARLRRGFVELTLFGAGVVLAIGPWLVKNAVETGNPVYPLAYSVFGGKGRDAAMDAQWRSGHAAKTYGSATERLTDLFVKLTDVAANNDWHSALMFGLAPIALLASWRRRVWCVWAFIGWQFLSWFLLTHHIDRFYVPMFPAVALLAGAGAAWLFAVPRGPLQLIATWFGALLVAANVLFNAGVMLNLGGFNAGRTELNAAREIVKSPSQKWLEDELAAGRLPRETKVLCVGEAALFHARFSYVYNTVFDRSLFEHWFFERSASGEKNLRPVEEIRATLRQHGITHVLVNWSEILRYREPGSYGYTDVAHPSRFAELQAAGVFGESMALPNHAALGSLSASRRKQIEAWEPNLLTTVNDEPAYVSVQVFPIRQ
jgi:4-amino-4-deoxy-L-arabinose transferase-like glycosyltransferase